MSDPIEFEVLADDEDERLDVVLGRRVPGLSRRAARRLGLDGAVRVDGRRAPPSTRVSPGQRVEIRLPTVEGPPPAPTVVHQTDRYVYFDKPAGLHSVARTPGEPGCLATAVAHHFAECAEASEDPLEAGAVHRLDRTTSGVIAFARNREAWIAARAAFADGRVDKNYLALCGAPPTWPPQPEGALLGWVRDEPAWAPAGFSASGSAARIRAPLGHGRSRTEMAVRLDGAPAATVLVPLEHPDGRDSRTTRRLMGARLLSGLRHQARVHMAWCGAPIVGDERYGGPPSTRLHLHALAIDLSAAIAGERRVIAHPPVGFFDERAC